MAYNDNLANIRTAFMPVHGLSHYSESLAEAFQIFRRPPLSGFNRCGATSCTNNMNAPRLNHMYSAPYFDEEANEKRDETYEREYTEFDITRAYTSVMNKIEHCPVFTALDEFHPFDSVNSAIDIYAFYVITVEPEHIDGILFDRATDLVCGYTVEYARNLGIQFEIIAVCKPVKLIETNAALVIRLLYQNKQLTSTNKKNIVNIVYGLCNKCNNTRNVAEVFKCPNEAATISHFIRPFGPDHWLSVRQGMKRLHPDICPLVERFYADFAASYTPLRAHYRRRRGHCSI
jgi:hypothetical protein